MKYLHPLYLRQRAFQVALVIKSLPANAGDVRDLGSVPGGGSGNLPPGFLPGKSHGYRATVNRITKSWTRKATQHTHRHTHTHTHTHASWTEHKAVQ